MNIQSYTWKKDSNELLDYECNDLINTTIKSSYEGSLIRINDQIQYISKNDIFPQNSKTKLLCNIECNRSNFFIKKASQEQMSYSETPWLIVKDLIIENKGVKSI